MTKKEQCRDCKFFEPNEDGKNGKCYRFPPQTTINLMPSGVGLDGVPRLKTVEMNAYPTPAAEQWCGEWTGRRENDNN